MHCDNELHYKEIHITITLHDNSRIIASCENSDNNLNTDIYNQNQSENNKYSISTILTRNNVPQARNHDINSYIFIFQDDRNLFFTNWFHVDFHSQVREALENGWVLLWHL